MPPPLLFPLGYTPKTPELQESALKTLREAGEAELGLVEPLRLFFGTLEKTKSPVPWAFLVPDFEGAGPVGVYDMRLQRLAC